LWEGKYTGGEVAGGVRNDEGKLEVEGPWTWGTRQKTIEHDGDVDSRLGLGKEKDGGGSGAAKR